jgi:Mitochondrial ribosomal protein subunit L20
MKRLRAEDSVTWSATQLAKKFDCSGAFVRFVIQGMSKERAEQQKLVTETVKSNWGIKRRVAREDRAIRKEKWFRDA